MSEIFFIADTHFGEDAIRRYENRPFKNTKEMDSVIIENWNKCVKYDDSVFVLGDFGANKYESNILNQLNGKKYLVKGNHDVYSNDYYRNSGFAEVYDKIIILDGFWILSHEPIYVTENMPYANIFGHIHNSPLYKNYSKQHYCVSVERILYTPISFNNIKTKIMEGENCEHFKLV